MKKILVSGYIGFDNFGDEAIFYALQNHLKEKNIQVSVLCNNPETVKKKYNVTTYYFKSLFQIIKAILKNDILISGGGSLLQNKTSNFSLLYYLFIIFLAKIFFKKVIIFSQGIEKINGRFFEFLTFFILKMANCVTVRDNKSLEYLKNHKINANLTSDPVYSIIEKIKPLETKNGVIVQLREFNGIDKKIISYLAEILYKNGIKNIKVFSFQDEYDKKICKEFYEELKKYNIEAELLFNKSIKETIEIINNAKYMISTRLHGAIISNALNTMTFALCYDDKIKTLCEEFSLENINLFNYSKEELNGKINKFLSEDKTNSSDYRRYDWSYIDNSI